MGKKFCSLKVGKVAFKVLAWISVVLGLILGIALLAGVGGPDVPRLVGLIWFVVGGLYFLFFYVLGEGIQLLLEIHDHLVTHLTQK